MGVSRSSHSLLLNKRLSLQEAGKCIRMAARQQRQEGAAHPERLLCAREHDSLGGRLAVACMVHSFASVATDSDEGPFVHAFRDKSFPISV